MFHSFQSRNFRLFFVGQLVSQVGNWLTMIAATLFVLDLTDSGIAIGVLTACQFAPVLIFGMWAGAIVDRQEKRRLLLIVQVVAMAQSFALTFLAFMGHPPLLAVYLVSIVGGFVVAIDNPARRAFIIEMVEEDQVTNAVSLNSALMTSARVIGPVLAGALIALVGFGWCFSIDAFSYFGALTALFLMRTSELRRPPIVPRAARQIRAGFRYVRRLPELWLPLLMMALIGTFAFNYQVVMPLLVERDFGSDDTVFTLLFSCLSVGSLLGALYMARRTSVYLRTSVTTAAWLGASTLGLAVAPSLLTAFAVSVVIGFAMTAFLTAASATVQIAADPAMRGRVLAIQGVVILGSAPIGGPIVGAVCEVWGPRAGMAIGGVACVVAAGVGAYVIARRARTLRPHEAPLTRPISSI